jgi:apolipoprotein N-acyltransferase
MYAIPAALGAWLAYVAWDALRVRAGEAWALYGFPALVALLEIAAYRGSEGGVWGTTAITQLGNLPLLQLASLGGVSSVGFLVAWVASLAALLLATPEPRRWIRHAAVLAAALVAVFTWGAIRLDATQDGPTVRVAGVIAELGLGAGGLPSDEDVARNTDALFARSEVAAARGARVVVWNEGATIVEKAEEPDLVERGARVARARGVDLVLAYVVPITRSPFTFENRYAWISDSGELLETYDKHHPVPGEGSRSGAEPLRALDRPWGRAAGAICYDYDFPAMALAHARLGAGLIFVPSSDWRGIDPYHSEMARIRAIEGGFSVVRPVRWATSMAFDAYGRQRAALPFFEENDRVLLATLPVQRVATVYGRVGDAPAAGAYALYLLAATLVAARRRHGRPAREPRSRASSASIGERSPRRS